MFRFRLMSADLIVQVKARICAVVEASDELKTSKILNDSLYVDVAAECKAARDRTLSTALVFERARTTCGQQIARKFGEML